MNDPLTPETSPALSTDKDFSRKTGFITAYAAILDCSKQGTDKKLAAELIGKALSNDQAEFIKGMIEPILIFLTMDEMSARISCIEALQKYGKKDDQ